MNTQDLENGLAQFTGSQEFYKYNFGLTITEGVKFLADNAANGAYWLIDAIGSYQPQLRRNQRSREFQLWILTVANSQALLTCRDDSDEQPVVRQEIKYTDFPLPEIKLYVEGGVVLLPGEH